MFCLEKLNFTIIVSVVNLPDLLSKASITRYIAVLTEQYYFSFEDNWII